MALVEFGARNFRIFTDLAIQPAAGTNVVSGPNGSGKTALLEAINFLATGKPFRGQWGSQLIREGAASLLVHGICRGPDGIRTQLGIERSATERHIRVNGTQHTTAAPLAKELPVAAILPETHHQLFQQATSRRALVDWGAFHVKPGYYGVWRSYQRALKQRNAALRARMNPQAITSWESELCGAGEALQGERKQYVSRWSEYFKAQAQRLLMTECAEIQLEQGWDANITLQEALERQRAQDSRRGFTHSGPHRADLKIRLNGLDAFTQASHGQQKLLTFALRLAQLDLLAAERQRSAVVLVDDLAAELDSAHRREVVKALQETGAQLFMTTTNYSDPTADFENIGALFHVKRGAVEVPVEQN